MNTNAVTRRAATALLASSLLPAARAADAAYPSRPVTMIVPFAAGNVTDAIARLLADRLTASLGQAVVVENKPGASGGIGMSAISRAQPDGYTVGLGAIGPLALNPALYSKLPYDPVNGFSVISVVYRGPMLILVHAASPWKTMKDLVEASQQGGLDYATPGAGSSQHLTAELFKRASGAKLNHVPNRGSGQAATLLLGKHVPVLFEVTTVGVPYVKQGQMRALAISSSERLPALPDVPTLREAGYPVSTEGWLCLIAPAGMPEAFRLRLADETRKIMEQPEVKAQVANLGGFATSLSSAQSASYVQAEIKRWGELIHSLNIKLD
ncbi:MAG: tripartite tricarboxylate transporter substrate binding protein [Ottowia sp.]|uniref:Bug family tripartite tricarboxylate transporter substrate binding protein n=1 Tax=unclassified Ottowia TaxID=2645081 RepID=UPI003C30DB23